MEPLISVIVALVVLGLVMWLIENYIPMAEPFRVALRVVVVIALIIWILRVFGIWSGRLTF